MIDSTRTLTSSLVERHLPGGQVLVDKQQSEGRILGVERLNTANFMPTNQLNTRSLESVVGQRSEGQVLADVHQSEGQVLKGERLNTVDFRPASLLNSLSLGHFAGQQPGEQVPANEHVRFKSSMSCGLSTKRPSSSADGQPTTNKIGNS